MADEKLDPKNLTSEQRARYEEALARWDERLKPLIDANREAERITADDLNIIIGPCAE